MGSHMEAKIPALTRQNFDIWKKRMETYLDSLDYLMVVDHNMAESFTAEPQAAWRKIDKKAKHIISSMVPDSFYNIIDGKATAKEIFEALTNHFMAKSVSKQIHLKREIVQLMERT